MKTLNPIHCIAAALIAAVVLSSCTAAGRAEEHATHKAKEAEAQPQGTLLAPVMVLPGPEFVEISVHFSPKGGCTDEAVAEFAKAKKTIHVLAYDFTSVPIADAMLAAKKRGVEVVLVADRTASHQADYQGARLQSAGCQVWTDGKHKIMHDKVAIVDGCTILTGSFNWSKAAEISNAENLLTIRCQPELAKEYEANFQLHAGHSEK